MDSVKRSDSNPFRKNKMSGGYYEECWGRMNAYLNFWMGSNQILRVESCRMKP